jgi:hypothetical protein
VDEPHGAARHAKVSHLLYALSDRPNAHSPRIGDVYNVGAWRQRLGLKTLAKGGVCAAPVRIPAAEACAH